jgi:hypothetical protein
MRIELYITSAGAMLAVALWTSAASGEPVRYDGVCEASAAAILNSQHFVVASDETEQLTVYERGKAEPVSTFVHRDVTDLEGAARVGDTVFWLTSHSLNKDGEDKPKRKLLFATTVTSNAGLADTGTPFRDFRARIAARLGSSEAELRERLNIEGLAATADGDLVVGLRGPLTEDKKAIVVKIEDPFSLVGLPVPQKTNAAPTMKPVSKLDLGGRGIRSIERIGSGDHTFLIVAGSVEDAGLPPALYWWDGIHEAAPGPAAPLAGLTPEAVIAWSDHELQILGDNGEMCSDEESNPRWFPSIDVKF